MQPFITTPIPLTVGSVRFVFFLTPQPVGDTLDNVPQFYLGVFDKKNPDVQVELYISLRILEGFELPKKDEEIKELATDLDLNLRLHLKKHFGARAGIVDIMPLFHDEHDGLETITTEQVIGDLLFNYGFIANLPDAANDPLNFPYVVITERDGIQTSLVSPATMASYRFFASAFIDPSSTFDAGFLDGKLSFIQYMDQIIATGTCTLFNKKARLLLLNGDNNRLPGVTARRFITPSLLEETLNKTIVTSFAKPGEDKEVYLKDVQFDNQL